MTNALERLVTLRVADVMSREVVCVCVNQTMADAADTLSQHRISGAPVVDEVGVCVGMISASDFVQRESNQSVDKASEHVLASGPANEPFHICEISGDLVSEHMTPAVQTISANASMLEAGRSMCAEHIHRLPVLDSNGAAIGVVSSLDLVSALVTVFDE